MKNLRFLIFSGLACLTLGSAVAQQPAIIVIRHATDAEDWVRNTEPRYKEPTGTNPSELPMWPSVAWRKQTGETETVKSTWPNYGGRSFILIKPDGTQGSLVTTLKVSSHGLGGMWKTESNKSGTSKTPYGEDQAISLGMNLDKFLADHNFAPIKRAITMNPTDSGASANPFDTLWPLLKEKTDVDFYLVEYQANKSDRFDGVMKLIEQNKVLPDGGGSTIICWTGEGMSGDEGIVAKLLQKYRGKTYSDWLNKGLMRRCNDMYIFSGPADGNGTAQWWSFNYAASDEKSRFELKDKHPADPMF